MRSAIVLAVELPATVATTAAATGAATAAFVHEYTTLLMLPFDVDTTGSSRLSKGALQAPYRLATRRRVIRSIKDEIRRIILCRRQHVIRPEFQIARIPAIVVKVPDERIASIKVRRGEGRSGRYRTQGIFGGTTCRQGEGNGATKNSLKGQKYKEQNKLRMKPPCLPTHIIQNMCPYKEIGRYHAIFACWLPVHRVPCGRKIGN